jgi:DNA polymerase-3 subunit alpha (Gram-positive type)
MLIQLGEMGITGLNELNPKLQTKSLLTTQFPQISEVYVKNQKGIKELYEVVSISSTTYLCDNPKTPKSLINKHRENLIFTNSPFEGDV